ncbi:TIGR03905 family TSCPD domain-containing protein [Desulfovibrio mangrovi]|uniref:TIGR03905 family TSCPD domain-containing protein n=1 Tax=Desulfovibrio mangrovi TaxID=2976983 RepID=UPI0022455ECA|nr:TIGR03905 family TSCPD domain-containing protein [Desulfovibrio mangrovi]UZP67358.1 TIGR03905 family TSCPD domain-containing protein [Desulfovibrio mangrovi]
MYTFTPSGVCAKQILFNITDGKIHDLQFVGGCPGSLTAITRLLEGQEVDNVITALAGLSCGKKATSCPDQLAFVLKDIASGNGDKHKQGPGLGQVIRSLNPFG